MNGYEILWYNTFILVVFIGIIMFHTIRSSTVNASQIFGRARRTIHAYNQQQHPCLLVFNTTNDQKSDEESAQYHKRSGEQIVQMIPDLWLGRTLLCVTSVATVIDPAAYDEACQSNIAGKLNEVFSNPIYTGHIVSCLVELGNHVDEDFYIVPHTAVSYSPRGFGDEAEVRSWIFPVKAKMQKILSKNSFIATTLVDAVTIQTLIDNPIQDMLAQLKQEISGSNYDRMKEACVQQVQKVLTGGNSTPGLSTQRGHYQILIDLLQQFSTEDYRNLKEMLGRVGLTTRAYDVTRSAAQTFKPPTLEKADSISHNKAPEV